MFNRRELLIGSIVTTIIAPLKACISENPQREADDFVCTEHYEPLSPDVRRALRWGRAGVISVFSPDVARVVTVGRTDERAYLWDTEAGTKLQTLQPISSAAVSVSFNSDGTHIAIVSQDGATRTWDATNGQRIS